jgi:chromosome partitioning protein
VDIIEKLVNEEEIPDGYAIIKHSDNIDLLPSNIGLSAAEVSLVNVMSRELVLKGYIDSVKDKYNYVVIDCMPSLGVMTVNALACADTCLVPVQAAFLPVKGLQALIKTIYTVKRRLNPKLEIEGILLTMVDNRTNYAKDIISEVNEVYGKSIPVFPIQIPVSVRATETSAMSKSIFEYDPKGKVAAAYSTLTEVVMKNS